LSVATFILSGMDSSTLVALMLTLLVGLAVGCALGAVWTRGGGGGVVV
jgi:hypothetical protein